MARIGIAIGENNIATNISRFVGRPVTTGARIPCAMAMPIDADIGDARTIAGTMLGAIDSSTP